MLMVPTNVAPSRFHGLGLFASQDIPAGTLVWRYYPGLDKYLTEEEYQSYPEIIKKFVDFYCNVNSERKYLFCVDNARFMNHSDGPNISAALDENVALRDITAGEEIVCDYREFDSDFHLRFPTTA
jgi:SET domain-containing protein